MALRTTGANWLALMMRAEGARRGLDPLDSEWLLYGPTDPDVVQDEAEHDAPGLLAAE
ncbi:hypothetical protein ACN2C6_02615 [Caulobacter sp. ErkDOM-YI]|uniref:hypothetical protein n=1 Tax=unclassified Caulobacter TaxID=2648921 RepID=UPI003AF4696D